MVNNTGTTNNSVIFADDVGTGDRTTGTGNDAERVAGKALRNLTLINGEAEFRGKVFAKTILANTTDGASFKSDVTAATKFAFDAENARVIFGGAGNQTITGQITATTNGQGRLVVRNTGAVADADSETAARNRVVFANADWNADPSTQGIEAGRWPGRVPG